MLVYRSSFLAYQPRIGLSGGCEQSRTVEMPKLFTFRLITFQSYNSTYKAKNIESMMNLKAKTFVPSKQCTHKEETL